MRLGPIAALAATLACQRPPDTVVRDPVTCSAARDHAGCSFHFADTDNANADDALAVGVFLASAGGPAEVRVEARGLEDWSPLAQASLPAGGAAFVQLAGPGGAPWDGHSEGEARTLGGVRIVASRPVWALLMNPTPLGGRARSLASALLVPDHAAGSRLRLPAPDGATLTLVGGSASTHVVLRTDRRSAALTLADGEVATFAGEDLAGATVEADAPLPALTGAPCAPAAGVDGGLAVPCDKTEEALPDVAVAAGRVFAVPPLPERTEVCQARPGNPGGTRVRIVATAPATALSFDAADPAESLPEGATLDVAGAAFTVTTRAGLVVSASAPVLVWAETVCEPAAVLLPPYERWAGTSALLAPSPLRETAVLVRKVGQPLSVDGEALDAAAFRPVGGGFEAATLVLPSCGLASFAAPPDDLSACVHRLEGRTLAVITAGDLATAYAHTATYLVAP